MISMFTTAQDSQFTVRSQKFKVNTTLDRASFAIPLTNFLTGSPIYRNKADNMFNRRRRHSLLLACGLACLAPFGTSAQAPVKKLSDYQVGDVVTTDIATPVELVVIDREASAALREKEAAKVPVFVRVDTNAAEKAVAAMRAALVDFREEFLITLEVRFGTRKLSNSQLKSEEFRNLHEVYRNLHKKFPLTLSLATKWAQGGDWAELETLFISRVRAAMTSSYVRPDDLPAEAKSGPAQVRLITSPINETVPDWAKLEKDSQPAPRQSLVPVTKARNEFRASLVGEEKPYAKFLAAFIQPNCIFDVGLTRSNRARRTEAIWTADKFRPGEVIARAGEPLTPRLKAALDQLAAQSAVTELRARDRRWETYWPWLAFAGGAGVVFVLAVRSKPRPAVVDLAPTRALAPASPAELLADKSASRILMANPAMRARLMPHFAAMVKEKIVTTLLSQRRQLIAAQRQAAAEIAALEERLEKIHAPLQERVKAYEARISDLEKELEARTAENRELINATIALAKQRLEEEKSGARVTSWN